VWTVLGINEEREKGGRDEMGKGYAEVEGVISGQGAQRGHVSGRRRRPSNGKTCTSFAIETLIGKEKGEGEAGRGREGPWT